MPMIWQQHANSTSPNEQGLKRKKNHGDKQPYFAGLNQKSVENK
jgi:hypothetical protein